MKLLDIDTGGGFLSPNRLELPFSEQYWIQLTNSFMMQVLTFWMHRNVSDQSNFLIQVHLSGLHILQSGNFLISLQIVVRTLYAQKSLWLLLRIINTLKIGKDTSSMRETRTVLKDMSQKGVIAVEGRGRGTKYIIK